MISRLLVILLGVPLIYLVLAAGEWPRLALFAALAIGGQLEMFRMLDSKTEGLPLLEFAAGIAILVLSQEFGERGLFLGFALAVVYLAISTVFRGLNGGGYRRFSVGTASLFYLPFCLGFFLLIGKVRGAVALFALVGAIWSLDIGAYVFGMTIRGPRLAPLISPKKTVAGAVGGALCCIGTFWLLATYGFLQLEIWQFWLLSVSVAIIGQVSDLFESIMKREAGVKDSGTLLGAHGGILDRIDSILFLGPVTYFILLN